MRLTDSDSPDQDDGNGAPNPASEKIASLEGPELFFGLVGPLGVPMDRMQTALRESLTEVGYEAHEIRLIKLASELPNAPPVQGNYADRVQAKMDLGNWARKEWGKADALARLAVLGIRQARAIITGRNNMPAERRAFILHQLKHPDEVRLLRDVYGSRFILIGGYAPRESRIAHILNQAARGDAVACTRANAEELIARDEYETDERRRKHSLGQHVRDAFPLSDFFVDVSDSTKMRSDLRRLVLMLFGHIVHTPTREEQGMFFAKAAAVRSASLARQVGAALTTQDGDLLTIGTNEVPKAGGGLYWEGDMTDNRVFLSGSDISDEHRRSLLNNVLNVLKERGWLSQRHSGLSAQDLAKEAFQGSAGSLLRETRLSDIIEFAREVHAEMAAITDAARRGIPLQGSVLYVTTFPCHECTRHIVAAGVTKVVFIEPYAKSLAEQFHGDSVSSNATSSGRKVEFKPFVGLSPRRYMEYFEMTSERKTSTGAVIEWRAHSAQPRITGWPNAYVTAEGEVLIGFIDHFA